MPLIEYAKNMLRTDIDFMKNTGMSDKEIEGYYKGVRFNEERSLYVARALDGMIEAANDALGKSTDTDTAVQSDGVTPTAYALVAAAKKAMEAAKALPETDDAEKAAKKAAIQAAEVQVAQANDNLAQVQYNVDNAAEQKADYETDLALLEAEDYNTVVANLEAAIEAAIEASDAFNAGAEDIIALQNEITALQNYSSYDVEGQIAQTEANIENLEKQIAKAEANLTFGTTWINTPNGAGYNVDYDSAIEFLEAMVDYYEAQIEALEVKAATYLAQIKELAEDEAAEEPTADASTEG